MKATWTKYVQICTISIIHHILLMQKLCLVYLPLSDVWNYKLADFINILRYRNKIKKNIIHISRMIFKAKKRVKTLIYINKTFTGSKRFY